MKFKKGGVSMFIVIVTTVLVALLVSSFVRMVNRDLNNATKQDLSQSAYDSAQAGIEDAKRALSRYYQVCASSSMDDKKRCEDMTEALSKSESEQSCRILAEHFGIGNPNEQETIIQTSSGDEDLNQAYTCVKINTQTADFLGQLSSESLKIIHLKSQKNFNRVRISWFNKADAGDTEDIDLTNSNGEMIGAFSNYASWPTNRPSVLRTQFVMSDGTFNFNNPKQEDADSSKTAFLYPSNTGSSSVMLKNNRHNFSENALSAVRCEKSVAVREYACSATIDLGREVSGMSGAFMKISSQYGNTTNFKIEMLSSDGSVAEFFGVQPAVDSTGRANERFRRVQARVEPNPIGSDFPIPEFAVTTNGKFCKKMIIRDNTEASTIECK